MFRDSFGIPEADSADLQVFNATGGTFQLWQRPKGKSMCMMIVIGSGSGGGAGFTGLTATVRGGGGGGGSGAIARVTIPIFALPDMLYVQVGRGGQGGLSSTSNGSAGERSFVSLAPNTTAANLVMASGAAAASGGTAGSVAGSAAAGGAETISTILICINAMMGITQFIAGKIGSVGGVVGGGNGSSNTLQISHFLNGGGGGGTTPAANTDFLGGTQLTAGIFPTLSSPIAGSALNSSGGMLIQRPFISYGGVGGITGGAGQAGKGGDGALGSGGGGGGGGITFGQGGRGGDGLVLIYSW